MTTCTYVRCTAEARHPKTGKDGKVWCQLCDAHSAEFERVVKAGDGRQIVGIWVRAQGGAEAAAARMKPELALGITFLRRVMAAIAKNGAKP